MIMVCWHMAVPEFTQKFLVMQKRILETILFTLHKFESISDVFCWEDTDTVFEMFFSPIIKKTTDQVLKKSPFHNFELNNFFNFFKWLVKNDILGAA